jgi:hypothetical protein
MSWRGTGYLEHDVSQEEISILVKRATRYGVVLPSTTADDLLLNLDLLPALRAVNGACKIICLNRSEKGSELSFAVALHHLEACGGDVNEASRLLLQGPPGTRTDVAEAIQYAADQDIDIAPSTIRRLIREHGQEGPRNHVDKLRAIMGAAGELGFECSQILASRRLSRAGGCTATVIDDFVAVQQRRVDRLAGDCLIKCPPQTLQERANAYAGCGCRSCSDNLVVQLQPYVSKILANPFYADLDRDEGRSEANVALAAAIDQWPGGDNFAGWFSGFFKNHVRQIYDARSIEERTMLSLEGSGVTHDERGSRSVSLIECLPDRSMDPAPIVERKLGIEYSARQKRQDRAERVAAYERDRRRAA